MATGTPDNPLETTKTSGLRDSHCGGEDESVNNFFSEVAGLIPLSSKQGGEMAIVEEKEDREDGDNDEDETKGALIVCSADGTVYTLDAWTGKLRGLFGSGGPLVGGASEDERDDDTVVPAPPRVIPGLDGRLYYFTPQYGVEHEEDDFGDMSSSDMSFRLDPLPVTVKDVVDNPISTCQSTQLRQNKTQRTPTKRNRRDKLEVGDQSEFIFSRQPKGTLNDCVTSSETGNSNEDFLDCTKHKTSSAHQPDDLLHPEEHEKNKLDDGDHNETEENGRQCGLVMAHRTTRVFALDPIAGGVQWMRDSLGRGGSMAARAPSNKSNNGNSNPIILLRREDYQVRSLDVQTGEEDWTVSVSTFDALDLLSSSPLSSSVLDTNLKGTKQPTTRTPPRQHRTSETRPLLSPPTSLTSASFTEPTTARARGANAVPPSKVAGFPSSWERGPRARPWRNPLSSRGKKDVDGEYSSMDIDDGDGEIIFQKNSDEWRIMALPLIALGEDGKSISAIDSATGDILWRKKVENVVASVFGVGQGVGDAGWVPLDVIDEYDKSHQGDSSTPEPNQKGDEEEVLPRYRPLLRGVTGSDFVPSNSVIPIDEEEDLMAIAGPRHSPEVGSSLIPYRRTKKNTWTAVDATSALPPIDRPPWTTAQLFATAPRKRGSIFSATTMPSLSSVPSYTLMLSDVPAAFPTQFSDSKTTMSFWHQQFDVEWLITGGDVVRPASERMGQSGLFLSWKAVTIVILALVFTLVICRLAYTNLKRKWQAQGAASVLMLTDSNNIVDVSNTQILHRADPPPEDTSLVGGTTSYLSLLDTRVRKPMSAVRSMSLPYIHSSSSGGADKPIQSGKTHTPTHLCSEEKNEDFFFGDVSSVKIGLPCASGVTRGTSVPSAALATTPDHFNKTQTVTASTVPQTKTETKTEQQSRPSEQIHSGPGSIGGFPLVRYSRYKSEFRELSKLGKGGFGTVFQCFNALDDREYAIKKVQIKAQIDVNGNVTKNFSAKLHRVLREVKFWALLDHPNIVRYYTAWLELEDEDNNNNNYGGGSTTTMSRVDEHSSQCFSSKLASTGPSATASGLGSFSHDASKQSNIWGRQSRRNNSNSSRVLGYMNKDANPLGWNNNFLPPTFDDSLAGASRSGLHRTPSQSERDNDIGFEWDRGDVSDRGDDFTMTSKGGRTITRMSLHSERSETTSDVNDNESISTNTCSDDESSASALHLSQQKSNDEIEQNKKMATADSYQRKRSFCRKPRSLQHSRQAYGEQLSGKADNRTVSTTYRSTQKHILYIQMQLCTQKTLADFLENPIARKGRRGNSDLEGASTAKSSEEDSVDIPTALRMFCQIARGVKHVHQRGLIHRDLKPSNCFIDDNGVVKIGDFGLSRESSSSSSSFEKISDTDMGKEEGADGRGNDDNTAGVGTRSYASPEQMKGSDYDSSTDVYSLGIMLFELCYPMYTGMERHEVFKGIRQRKFPTKWHSSVGRTFPTVHKLLNTMLSPFPTDRPSAAAVCDRIDSLLGEYTVVSLDRKLQQEGSVLLRVEAEDSEGVLARTMGLIKGASSHLSILQYSLRGQESKTIMEFALLIKNNDGAVVSSANDVLGNVLKALVDSEEVHIARDVTESHTKMGQVNNGIDLHIHTQT